VSHVAKKIVARVKLAEEILCSGRIQIYQTRRCKSRACADLFLSCPSITQRSLPNAILS